MLNIIPEPQDEPMLDCYYHPGTEAVAGCVRCHHLICENCHIDLNGKAYCPHCYTVIKNRKQPVTTTGDKNSSEPDSIKAMLKKMVEKLGD